MTSFGLKLLAILTMMIDHTAYVLAYMGILQSEGIYTLMRTVGRVAFPIFAFLLVVGFQHTRNRLRYLTRLLLFGMLSQPAFVWALFPGNAAEWNFMSNWCTLFTLAIGLAFIWMVDAVRTRSWGITRHAVTVGDEDGQVAGEAPSECSGLLGGRLLVGIFALVGLVLQINKIWSTDYGWKGVLLMVALSLLPLKKMHFASFLVLGWAFFQYEGSGVFLLGVLPAAIAIFFYNGAQGPRLKWLFYLFYPLHLLALGLFQWGAMLGR